MPTIPGDLLEAIDQRLRHDADGDDLDGMHLTNIVIVGLYEDLHDEDATYTMVTGNGNAATHVGLLELGRADLINA